MKFTAKDIKFSANRTDEHQRWQRRYVLTSVRSTVTWMSVGVLVASVVGGLLADAVTRLGLAVLPGADEGLLSGDVAVPLVQLRDAARWGYVVLAVAAVGGWVMIWVGSVGRSPVIFKRVAHWVPGFGPILADLAAARWTAAVANRLTGGDEAITAVGTAGEDSDWSRFAASVADRLAAGERWSTAMAPAPAAAGRLGLLAEALSASGDRSVWNDAAERLTNDAVERLAVAGRSMVPLAVAAAAVAATAPLVWMFVLTRQLITEITSFSFGGSEPTLLRMWPTGVVAAAWLTGMTLTLVWVRGAVVAAPLVGLRRRWVRGLDVGLWIAGGVAAAAWLAAFPHPITFVVLVVAIVAAASMMLQSIDLRRRRADRWINWAVDRGVCPEVAAESLGSREGWTTLMPRPAQPAGVTAVSDRLELEQRLVTIAEPTGGAGPALSITYAATVLWGVAVVAMLLRTHPEIMGVGSFFGEPIQFLGPSPGSSHWWRFGLQISDSLTLMIAFGLPIWILAAVVASHLPWRWPAGVVPWWGGHVRATRRAALLRSLADCGGMVHPPRIRRRWSTAGWIDRRLAEVDARLKRGVPWPEALRRAGIIDRRSARQIAASAAGPVEFVLRRLAAEGVDRQTGRWRRRASWGVPAALLVSAIIVTLHAVIIVGMMQDVVQWSD